MTPDKKTTDILCILYINDTFALCEVHALRQFLSFFYTASHILGNCKKGGEKRWFRDGYFLNCYRPLRTPASDWRGSEFPTIDFGLEPIFVLFGVRVKVRRWYALRFNPIHHTPSSTQARHSVAFLVWNQVIEPKVGYSICWCFGLIAPFSSTILFIFGKDMSLVSEGGNWCCEIQIRFQLEFF